MSNLSNLSNPLMEAMKKKIFNWENRVFFDHPCLNDQAYPSEYYKTVSHSIDLSQLYKVVDTCYYNQEMLYYPVLIEICEEKLRDYYGGYQYLLQVWNVETKKKVLQKPLHYAVKKWAITFNQFLYTLNEGDEDSDCLFIHTFGESESLIRIRGIGLSSEISSFSYYPSRVYLARGEKIEIYNLSDVDTASEEPIDGSSITPMVIDAGLKIQGFMQTLKSNDQNCILVIFETLDNQLEFNELHLEQEAQFKSGKDDTEFLFIQHAQKIKRDHFKHDPIAKYSVRHRKAIGTQPAATLSLAIRESGGIDSYYNMSRTSTVDNHGGIDLKLSFIMAIVTCKRPKENPYDPPQDYDLRKLPKITADDKDAFQLLHKDVDFRNDKVDLPNTYDFDNIEDMKSIYNVTYEQFGLEIAGKVINLFTSVQLRQESFQAILAHDKVISIFDMKTWKWTKHIELEDKIITLLNYRHSPPEDQRTEEDQEDWVKIYNCIAILENHKVVKLDFHNLTEDGEPTQSELFYDEEKEIVTYTLCQQKCTPLILALKNKETEEVTLSYIGMDEVPNEMELTGSPIDISEPFSIVVVRQEESLFLIVQKNQEVQVYEMKSDEDYTEEFYDTTYIDTIPGKIYGTIHSVCSTNPKKSLILFDEKNAYILKLNPNSFKVIENTYIRSVTNDNKRDFQYATEYSEKLDEVTNNIKYVDIGATIKNNSLSLLPVIKNNNSANPNVYVGLDFQRIGFFQSYDEFIITIIPNKNFNVFFNDIGSENYRLYKQIKDRLIILGKDHKIYTYDIVSGKLLFVNDADIDLSGFNQRSVRGYRTLLLVSSYPCDKEVNFEEFYPTCQLETSTKNQLSFRQNHSPSHLYTFREVEIINEASVKILMEFEYPFDDGKLDIITNEKKDLAVIKDSFGVSINKIIYQEGYKVKFEIIRQIDEFPHELHEHYHYRLDFFTPNFSKFINISMNNNEIEFQLQDSITGTMISEIPEAILKFQKTDKCPNLKPQMVINKLEWVDERIIRIINEDGVEKLFDVEEDFKELKFNQIPLFEELQVKEWLDEYHILKSRPQTKDPIVKLKRIYQDYKSLWNLFDNSTKADFNELLLEQDFEIINTFSHSFSIMSWQVANELREGKIKIDNLSDSTILTLLYSIFPGGNTIFHYLTENTDELVKLLEFCHPEAKSIKHHMPFIPNAEGKTALHLCIEKKASKAVNTLLRHLSLYPADHHSKAIKNVYHLLVEMKLADFDTYMESRFQQNEQHKKIEKLHINFDSIGFTTSSPWINRDQINKELVDWENVERKVSVRTLDIAGVYHYNDPFEDKFFDALAGTDMFEYFELKSIQALIDFNYPHVQKYLIWKLFVPYIFYHLLYLILIFGLFESRYEPYYMELYWITLFGNLCFATYFMINEMRQISNDGMNYFKSFWNYIDITPVFGMYAIAAFSVLDAIVHFSLDNPDERVSQTIQRVVVSIVTLFMWLKFLYFFRIFDKTSYLIRAIVEVVYTMRHFFLVLLFTIVGFGNAFLVISLGNQAGDNPDASPIFIDNYLNSILFSYRMVLGDFDTGAFGEVAVPLVWIMFLLFTVFNMIVMLNLLIAVISDAYAAVAEVSEQAMYQERASMIAENNYLIPEDVKKNYCEQNRLILVVTDLEDEARPTGNDIVLQKIEEVKIDLSKQIEKITTTSQKQHEDLYKMVDQLKVFQLQTMPSDTIKCKIFKHNLQKMTLFQMQMIHEDCYETWGCDGRTFTGCHSKNKEDRRTDPAEKFHHCATCGFDICEDCSNHYGEEFHIHATELISLEEVRNRQDGYGDGWGCDCRLFRGCSNNFDLMHKSSQFDIVYHNSDHYFDLCPQCADFYKIKE